MSSKLSTALAATLVFTVFPFTAAHCNEMSNVFLPEHVQSPEGQISLFAAYGSTQTDGRVPVYLVNRSSRDLILTTQDGDIFLKLQYQDAEGNWVRAQPHAFSWCENSYVEKLLRPGHFMLVYGFRRTNGIPRTIRYQLYMQDVSVSSNVGPGVVSEADIERASNDALSLHEGSFEYVSRVALSPEPVRNDMDHIRDLRQSAVSALASGRFNADESRRVLEEVRDTNPAMDRHVDRALRTLEQHQNGQSYR